MEEILLEGKLLKETLLERKLPKETLLERKLKEESLLEARQLGAKLRYLSFQFFLSHATYTDPVTKCS